MQGNYDLLRQAIRQRQPVIAFYEGRVRHFCPHVLGTKRGEARVLAFQYAGGSATGLPAGGEWRCMRVQGLTAIRLHKGPWRAGTGLTRGQACVDTVDIETPS
jgi:hypothetical protein